MHIMGLKVGYMGDRSVCWRRGRCGAGGVGGRVCEKLVQEFLGAVTRNGASSLEDRAYTEADSREDSLLLRRWKRGHGFLPPRDRSAPSQ
ncbi:unnamed protein product [Sphagnum balticum]